MASHQGAPTRRQLLRLPHISCPPPSPTPQPHPPQPARPLFTPRFRTTPRGPSQPTSTPPQLKSNNRNEPKLDHKCFKICLKGTGYPKCDQATKKLETSKKHLDSENLGTRIITIEEENTGDDIMEVNTLGKTAHKKSQWWPSVLSSRTTRIT